MDYSYTSGTMQPEPICEQEETKTFLSSYISSLFCILFFASVIGNSVILVILVKKEKFHSVTNIFFLNLVVSDLIFSTTLPFIAIVHTHDWIFGEVLCKMHVAAFQIGLQSFVIFITLITIDQYFTIVHSWSTTSRSRVKCAVYISCFAWLLSMLFSIPDINYYEVANDYGIAVCKAHSVKEQAYWWFIVGHYKHFILFYICPLAIILLCYLGIGVKLSKCHIRKKSRVLKVISVIAVLFFLCWTPYNILMFLMFKEQIDMFAHCNNPLQYTFHICQAIVYIHCCMNPFLYALLGTKFRRHLNFTFKRFRSKSMSQQQDLSLKTSMVNGL
ncbi:PREDICTED: C-C chemokine receptor type 3-like [Nanorana parkeri]|uniref:C-C chemokine receptor type 3-like n=1 Tax=Nanorana parkeri TaxID=125878 RepID=UPI0008541740|nr:PREDICTED: C-C chemokine receptor type 3-like [Nanorana parkeri]